MLDIAVESTLKIGAARKEVPEMPLVAAVHRDTDSLHSHILSVPVDIKTLERVRAPRSIAAHRNVLAPIEHRLGLSSPKAVGRWDAKRFHLPFRTWVRMDADRLQNVRVALLQSSTWEESMRKLAIHGIKFRETSANFSSSTRYYLSAFNSRRLDEGMAIQRDVFANCKPQPTAAEIVAKWGRFPSDYQSQIERSAPPGMAYRTTAIGGARGRMLYEKWKGYANHKRGQRENFERLFDHALKEARAKSEHELSAEEKAIIRSPKEAKASVLDGSMPMRFADWVESWADRGDKNAQWLCRIAGDGANVDPAAAKAAEKEGDAFAEAASASNMGDEHEQALESHRKVMQEQLAMSAERARQAERAGLAKRKRREASYRQPAIRERPLPLAARGSVLEAVL